MGSGSEGRGGRVWRVEGRRQERGKGDGGWGVEEKAGEMGVEGKEREGGREGENGSAVDGRAVEAWSDQKALQAGAKNNSKRERRDLASPSLPP